MAVSPRSTYPSLWRRKRWTILLLVFASCYWLWFYNFRYSWMVFNTFRPITIEVQEALSIAQNKCGDPNPPSVCYYYVVSAKDGDYRNFDPLNGFWFYTFKSDSATVQRELRQAIDQGPQVVWLYGLRQSWFSWFPNIMTGPVPLAQATLPNGLWWGLLLVRGGLLLLALLGPVWLALRWWRGRRAPGRVESLGGPIDAG